MSTGIAFLHPGQGSQSVGMGKDLCDAFPLARQLFAEADDILRFPLARVCFEGPLEELSQTSITQPAVFLHSVTCARLLSERGITPAVVAGHSLGEYCALVAVGVLDFETGLRIVRRRGELMQLAGTRRPGAMAALIGLDEDQVVALCDADPGIVVAANFNAPGQVVISGEGEAVDRVGVAAAAAGARRVVDLPVSGAFHSVLMAPAAQELAALLRDADFAAPCAPVVTNVSAAPENDAARLRQLLIEQMTAPVRWTASVKAVLAAGAVQAFEVGPGAVLKGLVRRIDRSLPVDAMGTAAQIAAAATKSEGPDG